MMQYNFLPAEAAYWPVGNRWQCLRLVSKRKISEVMKWCSIYNSYRQKLLISPTEADSHVLKVVCTITFGKQWCSICNSYHQRLLISL